VAKIIALVISVGLLAALYSTLDMYTLGSVLSAADPVKLVLSLLLIGVLVPVSAMRLKMFADAAQLPLSIHTAVTATLVANTLNLALPAKLGDLAKATMLSGEARTLLLPALSLSAYEKLADLFAVFCWGAIALAASRRPDPWVLISVAAIISGLISLLVSSAPVRIAGTIIELTRLPMPGGAIRLMDSWVSFVNAVVADRKKLLAGIVLSLSIWAGHFLQILLMAWAIGVSRDWLSMFAVLPMVIVAGLVPLTLAGIGTRDAAIVLLLGPIIGAETAAALGVLFWLRYLIPGLAGLPLIGRYADSISALRRHKDL
jgi:uncharacterized membrane protein YbhN (UPF0104 family)